MTIFGRIMNPKPDYKDAQVPLALAKRAPAVEAAYRQRLQKSAIPIKQEDSRSETSANISSADTSLQESTPAQFIVWNTSDIRDEVERVVGWESLTTLEKKSKIVDLAMADIGMGLYQWALFVLCGTGWAADNLWLQGVALMLPSFSSNFQVSENNVRYASCFLYVGCCLGASFWGVLSDSRGRKLPFNMALLITAIFGSLVATASSFRTLCGFLGALGFGVGGNLPIDGTVLLEALPREKRSLLTLLSVWWPIGQVLASLLAWRFLGGSYVKNMDWRYCVYCYGGISGVLFLVRLVFDAHESPYYLLKYDQEEAVRVVRAIASKNKTATWLTEEILNEIGGTTEKTDAAKLSFWETIRHSPISFVQTITPLFKKRSEGINTGILWFCWICIGMGYPLFNAFLPQLLAEGGVSETKSNDQTYRDYTIISAAAIPGCLLACLVVGKGGRKIPMAVSTVISGALFFCFSISKESKFQVTFSCLASFFENIMFGILYAYTPESFQGHCRGTGTGIAHALSRISGLFAPVLAANMPQSNGIPYVSAGLVFAAFIAMLFLHDIKREKKELDNSKV